MIGRLTGRVLERSPGAILLDVAGVGYALEIPLSTYYALTAGGAGDVSLHVHTHVREDALALYGFSTHDEKRIFERLIAISGVGPRTALAVLSGIGVADLERAVREADRRKLEAIPGIGRKTAERILLELRDRLDRDARRPRRHVAVEAPTGDAQGIQDIGSDAVSALVNLGYPREAAAKAVDRALAEQGDGASLESALKGALRALIR